MGNFELNSAFSIDKLKQENDDAAPISENPLLTPALVLYGLTYPNEAPTPEKLTELIQSIESIAATQQKPGGDADWLLATKLAYELLHDRITVLATQNLHEPALLNRYLKAAKSALDNLAVIERRAAKAKAESKPKYDALFPSFSSYSSYY